MDNKKCANCEYCDIVRGKVICGYLTFDNNNNIVGGCKEDEEKNK
jgi:hypothetical protein